jgi:hypothetical protein
MQRVILSAAFALAVTLPAQAQNGSLTRSFVSSSGVDTNPCTITQPCASFAQAYSKVGANGIVAALDPGKYGALIITGPVTINGNGWAAITGTPGNDAIDIIVASGNVTLTGLELDGAGAGKHGIYLTSPLNANATLNIRDCVVSNFLDSGIAIQPTLFQSGNVLSILIENTRSLNNSGNGIKIVPDNSGAIIGTITGTTVANNGNDGFDLEGNSSLAILTSIANSNGNYGIYTYLEGFLVLRGTVAIYNNTLDFLQVRVPIAGSPGLFYNSPGWFYNNSFGTFSAPNSFSDDTNTLLGYGLFGTVSPGPYPTALNRM